MLARPQNLMTALRCKECNKVLDSEDNCLKELCSECNTLQVVEYEMFGDPEDD